MLTKNVQAVKVIVEYSEDLNTCRVTKEYTLDFDFKIESLQTVFNNIKKELKKVVKHIPVFEGILVTLESMDENFDRHPISRYIIQHNYYLRTMHFENGFFHDNSQGLIKHNDHNKVLKTLMEDYLKQDINNMLIGCNKDEL